jgi:hypothetical protein
MSTEVPSFGEVPGERTGTSNSSQIESLNKSCVNTSRGVGSRLDLTQLKPIEGIGYFIVSSEHMMKLETIKIFL